LQRSAWSLKSQLSDESIGFVMGVTYRKLVNLLSARLKEFEITPEQWSVLVRIQQQGGLNLKEIAARTAKDQPSTTRIIDALYRKGLIDKEICAADRRSFLIHITDKGRELVERTVPVERMAIDDAMAGMPAPERALLKSLLIRMNGNLELLLKE
jgi:DNA-binding MarR family transcriptional regulator